MQYAGIRNSGIWYVRTPWNRVLDRISLTFIHSAYIYVIHTVYRRIICMLYVSSVDYAYVAEYFMTVYVASLDM